MEVISNLMHALSSPDAYEFEWRNGELCIDPKTVSQVQTAKTSTHMPLIAWTTSTAIVQARD